MITRICNKCGEEKALNELVKNKSSKYGRAKECTKCRVKAVQKVTDPVVKAAYDKERRKKKGAELRAYDRERAKLPHRKAAHNEDTRKRRAKLKDAIPDDYDREGVLAMYKLAQKISNLTGIQMHVDHIIPLACGGEHNVKNLQLLAGTLNIAKGANVNFQLPWSEYPK